MIYPSADKLEAWGSKFALVTLAAKRAKQLKSGSPARIETNSRNTLTIALEEIAAGKVITTVAETDTVPVVTLESEAAQLLAFPTEAIEDDEDTESIALPDVDEGKLAIDDEEELEDDVLDEEDELPLDAGLDIDVEPEADSTTEIIEELTEDDVQPKKRGRRKASVKEDIPDLDADVDVDLDIDIDIDEIEDIDEDTSMEK